MPVSTNINYHNDISLLDDRDIQTRRHDDGIPFKVIPAEHYKVKQDPLYRAIKAWNNLPVVIRNALKKEVLKREFLGTVKKPYAQIV